MEREAEVVAAAPEPVESDHHIIVAASGNLRGEMSLRTPRPVVLAVAQLFLGETPDAAAEFRSDHQEAFEEFLRQVAGHAATGLKPLSGDVQLRVGPGAPPSWPAAASGWLASAEGAPCRLGICCQLSAALNASLAASTRSAVSGGEPAVQVATGQPCGTGAGPGANLDLLLDVELEVMLRFGERRMLLRDILELGAGSVVELDRGVEEPADLLLDGKLIARGEVVVVDGNYGLRVLEVVSSPPSLPEERSTP
jgi:flagellar motor switch protein FliN/FliY